MPGAELFIGPDRSGLCVRVVGNEIAAVGQNLVCPPAARRLSAEGASIAAGAVNAHTHMYSGLAPFGMPSPATPPKSFVEILEAIWWRLDRALDASSLRASARYYVQQALSFGTTSLVDHHESPSFIEGSLDVLAEACEELGVRALLTYGASERNRGREEAELGLSECARFIRSGSSDRVRGLIGLHASFTVSDETVKEAGKLARALDTVVHVHLAEAESDLVDSQSRGFSDPLDRLLALEALPRGSILAHGVHLPSEQVKNAEAHGLWLVQNPRSNANNAVGYPKALSSSRLVALGTDGFAADMDAENAALEADARAHHDTDFAARLDRGHALISERFSQAIGPLRAEAKADLVVRDEHGVRHVLVDGRPVIEDRRLLTGDEARIRAEAEEAATHLFERMRAIGAT